ncbi:unnamed protein product [Calypogeia fissa]
MGPQRQKGIYIDFDSRSIIRFLEPITADVFKSRFQDCDFFEDAFPRLSTDNQQGTSTRISDLQWQLALPISTDPRTREADEGVKRILHLHQIMQKLPDAFTDAAAVTRSHVEAANAPSRILPSSTPATEAAPKLKRGRPPGSKDQQPRQRRTSAVAPTIPPTLVPPPPNSIIQNENEEISINYIHTGKILQRENIQVDDIFAFTISEVLRGTGLNTSLPYPQGGELSTCSLSQEVVTLTTRWRL